MDRHRHAIGRPVGAGLALVGALLVAATAAAVDLNGHWLVENGSLSPVFVEISQVGDVVSLDPAPFTGTSDTLSGSVTGAGDFILSGTGSCPPELHARLLPDEDSFHGIYATFCSPFIQMYPRFSRCSCFDGNATDGDGCDASCQIEPCFACGGAPSVCTPTADGLACDDRRDCTSGETCAAGFCGGGTAVVPCTDITGSWHLVETVVLPVPPGEYDLDFVQRNGTVRAGSFLGTIDAATGAFNLSRASTLSLPPFSGTAGVATLSGMSAIRIDFTIFGTQVSGTRNGCGDGILGPGEQCDDGGATGGDGCDTFCQAEPCHTCSGAPSVCSAAPDGTPCSDGDACTTGDGCSAAACAGTPVACGACTACAPATGTCAAAPRPACRASTRPHASTLVVRNSATDRADALAWTWARGAATTAGELGNPVGGDDYALCVFDESSTAAALLLAVPAPGGEDCAGAPCWRPRAPEGFVYANRGLAPDGVLKLTVVPGGDGTARATLKARGSLLAPPALPLPLPLRVQLQAENGTCFESRYDAAGVIRNDPASGRFKARGAE